MRTTFLPFSHPDIDEDEIYEVAQSLRSGWITTGPKTKLFEKKFAEYVGAKFAIAVNSCTAAMHLALDAIGLKAGDEVIISPITFAATAAVVRYFEAKPVLVDIDPSSINIDPLKIPDAITKRTRAILPVHLAGLPAEMGMICSIARQFNLTVIEDAAHALPRIYMNRNRENLGDIVCYSFYATKTMTTGEGGMICTEQEAWAERCRIMSLHGISHDAWKRYSADGSWYYEIIDPGFKYNMTDMAAALGLVQIEKVDAMWQKRRRIADRYNQEFSNVHELQIPEQGIKTDQHAWHLYILRLNLEQINISRNKFIDELKNMNIGTSVHFIPIHMHPYYRSTYRYSDRDYPNAFHEYQRMISLPIYSKMTDQDVDDVIEAVLNLIKKHRR